MLLSIYNATIPDGQQILTGEVHVTVPLGDISDEEG